jgi:glycosyltransferase involved in cell wall biosynthesis
LTTGLAVGGAEAQVDLLARTLQQRDWVVEIVSMLAPEAFTESLASAGIRIHDLSMRRGSPDPRAAWKLRAILKKFRPHVLHCHMVHANLLGRLVGRWCGVPVVIATAHSLYEGGWWREAAYRLTDGLGDLTTNVSQAGVRRYVEQRISPAAKTIWVPNGLDLRPFHETADRAAARGELGWDGGFVWIAVGNLREPKDYPNLLAAFAAHLGRMPGSRLAIAGGGPLEGELRRLASALGLESHVQFLGVRRDIATLLSAADAYVISSAWEGTPMALLEAGAAALPVVATDAGGNREVIENGAGGRIVPCGDPVSLAAAMTELQAMPEVQRRAMGEVARRRVAAVYDIERVVNRWENIYRQLLACGPAEARQAGWRIPLPGRRAVNGR